MALSLLGAPVDIQGIPGIIRKKREELERMTSKLEVLNTHQTFFFVEEYLCDIKAAICT